MTAPMQVDDETLRNWEARIVIIDVRLRPLATQPMDPAAAWTSPLEAADVREPTAAILSEMIAGYRATDAATRQRLRALFASHPSFAWAATLPYSATMSRARFDDHLTLFSLRDQGRDTRDAILELDALCADAKRLGFDLTGELEDAAALSSDVDKYGMGSTRRLLLERRSG